MKLTLWLCGGWQALDIREMDIRDWKSNDSHYTVAKHLVKPLFIITQKADLVPMQPLPLRKWLEARMVGSTYCLLLAVVKKS